MVLAMFYATIVIIFGLGATNYGVISPQSVREYGYNEAEAPECQPLSAHDVYGEDREPRGKLANFSTRGRFRCRKTIFNYGERSSYYDHIVASVPIAVTPALSRIKTDPEMREAVWAVRIDDNAHDAATRSYVASYVQQALYTELGSGHIARTENDGTELQHILYVTLRETTIADQVLGLTIKTKSPGASQERVLWRN